MAGIDSLSTLLATNSIDVSQTSGSSLSSAIKGGKYANMTPDKAEAAAKDFETMFVTQMLEQMFGESSGEEAFGNSETNDIYKSLLMDQYGKLISRAGGIGIASYVKQELLKQQEVQS